MRVRRIIYFHLGGLGDCIHDLSSLSQLVSCYPNARVYYICKTHANSILKHSYLDKKIITITLDNFFDIIKAIFKAPFRADYFIVGCGSNIAKVNIFKNFLFPRVSGASLPDYPDQKLINFWTKASTFDLLLQPIKGAHRVFTNWSLMGLLGIEGEIHPPQFDLQKVREVKISAKIREIITEEYLVLHHGAASLESLKHFDESKWSNVIDLIIEKYDINVLLVGGEQEIQSSKEIIKSSKYSNKIFDITGDASLPCLMNIMSHSKLVLGTDSGPGHIAAALEKPTVTVFGPTDPRQCAPLAENGYIVYHPVDCGPCYLSYNYTNCSNNICMTSINPYSVYQAASLILNKSNAECLKNKHRDVIEKCPSVAHCLN
jgi:ADP-heptose:LPS heptosyltransferase